MTLPPFPSDYRASGVLLHVTSLPSPYGIGDVGATALAWIDHLHDAGQSWWQALPLGPTGYGDSPYQSLSSFAGNGLLISPDWLIEDGLLRASDCAGRSFSSDRGRLRRRSSCSSAGCSRRPGPTLAAGARPDLRPAYEQFCQDHALLAGGLRAVSRAEGQVRRRLLSRRGRPSWSGALRARWPRPGESWRARSIRFALPSSCSFARRRASSSMRSPGRAADRRPAVLRVSGLE